MVLVVIESSEKRWPVVGERTSEHAALVQAHVEPHSQAEDLLVATEEAGTQARRQIRPIAPWTHQAVQPALGQMRIGSVAEHR